ncbi:MAG: hypothetical protein ABI542_12370, partial [Gemmatimonadota bacterium]
MRALADDLRADAVMVPTLSKLRKMLSTSRACVLTGIARSKSYRWASMPLGPVRPRRVPVIPWALSPSERVRGAGLLDD